MACIRRAAICVFFGSKVGAAHGLRVLSAINFIVTWCGFEGVGDGSPRFARDDGQGRGQAGSPGICALHLP